MNDVVVPLGYDLPPAAPGAKLLDHIVLNDEHNWVFCSGPDPMNSPILEVPKANTHTREDAEEVARHTLRHMRTGYEEGEKRGREDVQRFFRLALGVEEPTREERAEWGNPAPLKGTW